MGLRILSLWSRQWIRLQLGTWIVWGSWDAFARVSTSVGQEPCCVCWRRAACQLAVAATAQLHDISLCVGDPLNVLCVRGTHCQRIQLQVCMG